MSKTFSKTTSRVVTLAAVVAVAMGSSVAFANDDAMKSNPTDDSEQPVTDTWITTKVKSTLLATEDVAGTDINVTTVDGVVTLAGVLDSQASVDKAVEATRAIEGVVSVDTRALKTR